MITYRYLTVEVAEDTKPGSLVYFDEKGLVHPYRGDDDTATARYALPDRADSGDEVRANRRRAS